MLVYPVWKPGNIEVKIISCHILSQLVLSIWWVPQVAI